MNEFIAGAISGIGQTFVGHPFDTAKIRIQNNLPLNNLKPQHYFRGIIYPTISSSIINSIIFSTYHNSLQHTNNKWISGMLSGLACSPVVYLFDVYKTKRQIGLTIQLDSLIKSRGFIACILRESISFSSYFVIYDYMRDKGYNSLIGGSIAGAVNWASTYPLDVIRNRQMAKDISFYDAYAKGRLWTGFNACITRAIVVNAVGFYIYEECMKYSNISKNID